MTQCTVCHRALKAEAVEDTQRNLDIVLKAVKCVRKWIDRGVRSSGADMRLDYKRRIRRAERLGFTSVVDRFINDGQFHEQVIELGWNQHTIADVDTIGNRPALENIGRSYHQRWKYEGWYDRHEEDPQGQPNRDLELAPTHIISNLRRRQETQYWKGEAKG